MVFILFSILVDRIAELFQPFIELCSALFNYVRKFRPANQILFGW